MRPICMFWEHGKRCERPGNMVSEGIALCGVHETRLLNTLKRRKWQKIQDDQRLKRFAEGVAGEKRPESPVYRHGGEVSGGLPSLGKGQ